MRLKQAIRTYIAAIAYGKSIETTIAYKTKLSRLANFLEDVDISEISIDDLERFKHYLFTNK